VRFRSLLCGLALSLRAFAAEPEGDPAASETKLAEAKARYEQGVEAYASGHFKDAVDLFLEADRMSPSAPLSFNIARAYEKLGDDSGALRWYRDYLRRAPDAPNAKGVEELVLRFESRLARKGVQQLTVISEPTGATVSIDEKPVGVTPWTGDLTPGPHRVGLTLRGYLDATNEVEVARDRAQDLSMQLVLAPPRTEPAPVVAAAPAAKPEPPVAAPGPGAEASQSSGFGVWPWVTLGAGGAALGAGVVFEFLRQSSEERAEGEETQIGYKEALDEMESRRTTARVLVGVGGALAIAGGTLLIIDLSGKKKSNTALLWSATPTRLDATLTGSF
jgi:tetratricopeptide (TPR) repeat protein